MKFILTIFLVSAMTIYCGEYDNDTIAVKLGAVEVNASRVLSNASMKYGSYHIIDKAKVDEIAPWQLSELINTVAGVQINDYGGLGGIKTLSVRGTNSNQNVVMIDGIKINSAQNGITDLSILPSFQFDDIEVMKGGNSSIFGASAIAGVVNLTNIGFVGNDYELSLYAGSFDEYLVTGKIRFGADSLNQSLFLDYKTSAGEYSFIDKNTKQKRIRDNNFFSMFSISSLTKLKLADWDFSTRIITNISKRDVPGPVLDKSDDLLSGNLDEESIICIFSSTRIFQSSSLYMGLKTNISSYENINNNVPDSSRNSYEFTNRDISMNSRYALNVYNFNINTGLEISFADLRGNQLDYSVGDYIKRHNISLFVNAESDYKFDDLLELDYFIGFRSDYYSNIENALSAFAGTILSNDIFPVALKMQVSNNFRPPNFNEMYYMNYGNTNLKPEKSISANLGLMYKSDFINIELSGFYINTNNQIVSIPKNSNEWSAENISNAIAKGIELSCSGKYFNNLLDLSLSYTLQDVRDMTDEGMNYNKYIVYTSPEKISFSSIFNYNNFKTGVFFRFNNFSYSLADNSYSSMILQYFLFDCFAEYYFKIFDSKLSIRADIKNILNQQYEIILNYPMPGRSLRAGIKLIL